MNEVGKTQERGSNVRHPLCGRVLVQGNCVLGNEKKNFFL